MDKKYDVTSFTREKHLDGLSALPILWEAGLEARLLELLLTSRKLDQVTTTTFRPKDKLDISQRQRLITLGFQPDEELTEFGYPTQLMIYPNKP